MSEDAGNPDVESIRLVDRNSGLDRFDDDDAVRSLIRGLLHNRQISGPADNDPEHLVQSLKYTRETIPRRDLSPLDEFDEYDIEKARDILEIFGEELEEDGGEALEFQLKAWDTISELDDERIQTGENQGAVLSAPTGFGKTWAFMGPIYDKVLNDRDFSTAILVFPRTALLRDQLSEILERLVHIQESDDFDSTFSVGTWINGLPYEHSDITDTSKTGVSEDNAGRKVFTLADYWDDDSDEDHLYISADRDELFNDDVSISFDEFQFAKEEIKDDRPDILLTTLESLELFSLKPNWNVLDSADAIVLDEVHQYSGLRGSHAANVLDNIKKIRDDPLLFLGVSATLEKPYTFGRKLFGLTGEYQLRTIEPPTSDYKEDSGDYRNHYFLLSREDGPGAASMYLQQMMLLGHSMLDPAQGEEPGELAKILSFIDSKSQINQRGDQFRDADENDKLWQYHDRDSDQYVGGDQNDDYRQVATDSDHEFIERPIRVDPFHADSETSISDLDEMEIIQSTSSLEVGIDIDDIEVVTQYREPLGGLSAFVQRVGRAGRDEDTDAHVLTFLSSYAGDTNFYYRADRFLKSDITTPLRTDNDVVNDLHDMSLAFYEEMYDLYQENRGSWWRDDDVEREMLKRVFADRLDAEGFYHYLTSTEGAVYAIAEFRPGVDTLLTSSGVSDLRDAIGDEQARLDEEIEEIKTLLGNETDQVIQGNNPVNGLLDRIAENSLNTLAQYEDSIEDDEVLELIENARRTINEGDSENVETRLEIYQELPANLMILFGKISQVEGEFPSTEPIQDIINSLENIETAVEEGTIEKQRRERKLLHYLGRSLDEIEEYVNAERAPRGSLYYVKHLFRAAFFFDQCLRLREDQTAVGLNYYPEDYFGGGGQTFTLDPESRHETDSEESLDRVINQYAPFKAEYLSRPGELQVFVPNMVTVDGDVMLDFDNLPGRQEGDIKIPERIPMAEVEDITETRSMGVVYYDSETYQLFRNYQSVPPRTDEDKGKVHSEPHVTTQMDFLDNPQPNGNLSMGDVSASAAVEAVTLEISPVYWSEDHNEYRFTGNTQRKHIESTDPKLGFILDTRGISWELTEFIDSLDAVRDEVARFKDFDEISLEEIGLNTAAHFLSLLIADISGVNPEELLHGINLEEDDENCSAFVFEQTEGGQGIVDLFYETLDSSPHTVLRSMSRLLYNSQIENEELCAHDRFVDEITGIDPSSEENRHELIRELLDVSLDPVVQRISEELLSTVDKVNDIVEECELEDAQQVYELKQRLAEERLNGTDADDIPEDFYDDFEELTAEVGTDYLEELLVTPDADGCAANLHMNTTLFNIDQSDTLSYVIVKKLREYVLERVSQEDDAEEILGRGQLWGGEEGDTVIFPSF